MSTQLGIPLGFIPQPDREQGSVSRVSRVSSLPPTSGVALVEPRLD